MLSISKHEDKGEIIMDEDLRLVVDSLRDAGYDPVEQLIGYLQTGQLFYITRTNGARDRIQGISKDAIEAYVMSARREQGR